MESFDYLKEVEQALGLDLIECDSSNVWAFAYDSEKKKLWVIFKNRHIYAYKNVPYQVANGLHLAESKGRYHATSIKGHYDYEQYELQ